MTGKDFSTQNEIWKPIPEFEGYEVSNWGRVRSFIYLKKKGYGIDVIIMPEPQRIMKPFILNRGYCRVALRKDNKPYYFKVHTLVLTVFDKPRPDGYECCHNDGNPSNNSFDNLRWDTHINNQRDRLAHGTKIVGEKYTGSKLTEIQVREIRILSSKGTSHTELANHYGVARSTIYNIDKRKKWAHVQPG